MPFRDSVSQYLFWGVLICICHNVYQICNLEYTQCKIKNCKENINMPRGHFADRLQVTERDRYVDVRIFYLKTQGYNYSLPVRKKDFWKARDFAYSSSFILSQHLRPSMQLTSRCRTWCSYCHWGNVIGTVWGYVFESTTAWDSNLCSLSFQDWVGHSNFCF